MPIVKYVADILGILMNGIYYLIDKIGIPNVALAIIIFTLILLLAMTPLQIKQQRFSKLNTLMQPELKKIQKKYAGKKDQVSQQKMMDETNAVYAKYGVSATGSCVQLLIQMPVLFGLYQVIYKIPGYITIIGNKIGAIAGNTEFSTMLGKFVQSADSATLTRNFGDGATANIIDTVYGLNTKQWAELLHQAEGSSFYDTLKGIHSYVSRATNFLGLNISDSPMDILKSAWADKAVLLMIAAIAFPVLAWFTQWITFKLMPQPAVSNDNDASSQMTNTMQSMNNFMPLMSAFFCLTLPTGVGVYWIISAVIRAVQQLVINKKLDSESVEEIVEKAQKKADAKRAKEGLPPSKITSAAHVSTRTLEAELKADKAQKSARNAENLEKIKESTAYYNQNARPGSIASKANMVARFDEKNNNGKKRYKK